MSRGVWVVLAGQSENDFILSDRIAYDGYFGRSKLIPIGSLFKASNWARFVSSNDAAASSVLSGTLVLLEERRSDVDGTADKFESDDEFESDDDATFCAERLAVVTFSPWLSGNRLLFVEWSRWNWKCSRFYYCLLVLCVQKTHNADIL